MSIIGRASTWLASAMAPLKVLQSPPLFFDDFDNTNTSLTGRAGWSVAGDAPKAGNIYSLGGMARMKPGLHGESPYGFQLTAAPTQNRRISFSYDYSQQGGSFSDDTKPFQYFDQQIILAWVDSNNYTYIYPDISGSVLQFRLQKVVAGASSELVCRYPGLPLAGAAVIEMTDKIRMYINGQIRVAEQLYNQPVSAFPDLLFEAGTPAIRTGKTGFRHCFFPLVMALDWKVESLDITVADPKGFYGRDETLKRTITFGGTYTGAPVSWTCRLRKKSSGVVIQDWTALTATASAGNWSASITVGTGGPYIADFGWTGADGKTRVTTSSPFSVGVLVVCWGQSNAGGMAGVGGSPGYGGNELLSSYNNYVAYVGSPFERWMDELTPESQSFNANMMGLAKSLSDAIGIPVGVAATGTAATELALLKPGTANWNTNLVPLVAAIGGNVECWAWLQGEAEGLSLSDYSNYVADYALLVAGLRTLGGRPNAMVFNQMILKSTTAVNNTTTIARAAAVRSILKNLENGSNVWTASTGLGLALVPDDHYTDASSNEVSRRMGLTVARRAFSALAYDGRGPIVTSASSSGLVITMPLDLNGATSVTGAALTGYEVSNDNFATTLALASVGVASGSIVITLSSTPTGTLKVRSFVVPNYNDSSLAVGSYSDGSTIPVFPIIDAITVS